MKEEVIIRIFSAIILSAFTGSCLFLYWNILCRCFMNEGNQRLFELGIKITLLCYYVPVIYIMLVSFYEDGFLFDIPKILYYKVINIIFIVWMIGSIGSFGILTRQIYQLRKAKRQCFKCKKWMIQILEECKRKMKIKKDISIVWGYQINVPMIAGMIRPCIFLPVKEFSKDKLKICLYHELNHYKKQDILWNYLSSGIICIHWYFPLVRKVWQEIDQWSEISCDIRSVQYVGSVKKYFSIIVDMSEETREIRAYTMVCLFENVSLLEKRIKYVRKYIKRGKSRVPFVAILVLIFLILGGVSVYAMTDQYHEIYVDWVRENEKEVKVTDGEEINYNKLKEKRGKLSKNEKENIINVNLKGDTATGINDTINRKERICYKGIYVKNGEQITLDIANQKEFDKFRIRVGIGYDGKNIRYVEEKRDDKINHNFNIDKEGQYNVYIENISNKKVKVLGSLAIIIKGEIE